VRCGQCRWIGTFASTIRNDDHANCRWCNDSLETIEHLFSHCKNREIRKIKRENGIRKIADVGKIDMEDRIVKFVWSALDLLTPGSGN